jgi:hypothetical protein
MAWPENLNTHPFARIEHQAARFDQTRQKPVHHRRVSRSIATLPVIPTLLVAFGCGRLGLCSPVTPVPDIDWQDINQWVTMVC